ncbi:hypothetical protein FOQG_19198 [Fusarium oxysporum f. sp. raphani 54005]|uniref:Uncharacterized protein n=1 Tax=Fusarium oxysporum f. sp. raphani 54005 TaxID=1089458 RepID=X0B1N7_FUSOX|nr:hypothetical protein FOQG_19198 [Fusarium oxysporum f. sp. raphani 54005]
MTMTRINREYAVNPNQSKVLFQAGISTQHRCLKNGQSSKERLIQPGRTTFFHQSLKSPI